MSSNVYIHVHVMYNIIMHLSMNYPTSVYTKTQVDRVIRNVVWDVVFGHKPQTTVTYYRASRARNCVCVMLQRYEYYYKDMPAQ